MAEEKRQMEDVERGNEPVVSTTSPGHLPFEQPPAYASQPRTEPPTYTNDGPPAYDAIFGKVRKAKEESNNNAEYAWKVFAMICCGTICTIFQVTLCLAIPIASIVIGSLHLKDCTIEKYIPIYLIVSGVFGIVKGIIDTIYAICNRKKEGEDDNNDAKKKANPIGQILNCFLMAWFIAGSVWVYRIYGDVDYEDSTSDSYCDRTTYLFTFWLITCGYILMALGLLCCCCVCAVMTCVAIGSAGGDN